MLTSISRCREWNSLSVRTKKTYGTVWEQFQIWCKENSFACLPESAASSEALALFLQKIPVASLDIAVAAVVQFHTLHASMITGDSAVYIRVKRAMQDSKAKQPPVKKIKPITLPSLAAVCKKLHSRAIDVRDKAILTATFFGCLSLSEVLKLDFEHIRWSPHSLEINIGKERIFLTSTKNKILCPVIAMKEWIGKAKINSGALFRSISRHSGHATQRRLSKYGLCHLIEKRFGQEYSPNSLRKGLAMALLAAGIPLKQIRRLVRQDSLEMLLEGRATLEWHGASTEIL